MSPASVPKRQRATGHSKAVRLRLLPSYVDPEKNESLLSWTCRLAGNLGVSLNVFARRILGIDSKLSDSADSVWWAYPSPWILARLAAKTDLRLAQLKHMTFADWAPKFREDDARERFSGRFQTLTPGRRRAARLAVCMQCLDDSKTPYLHLSWMLGWLAVCPTHQNVLLVRCSHCKRKLHLPSFTDPSSFNPGTCTHCRQRLIDALVPAHLGPVELQTKLLQGKRSGRTELMGAELTWPQTVTVLDLLVNLFWTATSFEERGRFAAEFADALPPIGHAEMSPYHSRYGGLCMLSWLLSDWDLGGRGSQVARELLSRWLAGSQPQASRFAGIKPHITSSALDKLWDTPETHLRSILVAACGDAHSGYFTRSPAFYS